MLKPAFAQEKGPKSASTADRVQVGVVKKLDYIPAREMSPPSVSVDLKEVSL